MYVEWKGVYKWDNGLFSVNKGRRLTHHMRATKC
jgi:hypothetical protein